MLMQNILRRARGAIIACGALSLLLSLAVESRAGVIQEVIAGPSEIRPGEKLFIRFRLGQPARVRLTIIDTDLTPVRGYDLGDLPAGVRQVEWDARDDTGRVMLSEAYTWTIEAVSSGGRELWEPAWLRSRPVEHIAEVEWDLLTRTFSYRTPAAMRVWTRISISNGACMRLLAEGEPRPHGVVSEIWDGRDEAGSVDFMSRTDWVVSVFGYRLPFPCVIVTGSEAPLDPPARERFRLEPPLKQSDEWWTRRRAFTLADRKRLHLRMEQLDPFTFAANLDGAAQRMLADRFRVKWFIDGHCGGEEVDGIMPSLMTFTPEQIPADGKPHFVTVNLFTSTQQVCAASMWIEREEETE